MPAGLLSLAPVASLCTVVPPSPCQEAGDEPKSLPSQTPTCPKAAKPGCEPNEERSPIPTVPMEEQGTKQTPGVAQENTPLPALFWQAFWLFTSTKFSSSPFYPLITPGHLGLHEEQSRPRPEPGLPSSLPYSSHTPIYYFSSGSHRNPCLWTWQEATMLLFFFFNI